jgi:hypothetical protein
MLAAVVAVEVLVELEALVLVAQDFLRDLRLRLQIEEAVAVAVQVAVAQVEMVALVL